VLVLSSAFIVTPDRMEELHLLLERRRQGSKAELLPVLYDIPRIRVVEAVAEYNAAAGDQLKQQWAKDLEGLLTITAMPKNQVYSCVSGIIRRFDQCTCAAAIHDQCNLDHLGCKIAVADLL
jgi:hypothetical protein